MLKGTDHTQNTPLITHINVNPPPDKMHSPSLPPLMATLPSGEQSQLLKPSTHEPSKGRISPLNKFQGQILFSGAYSPLATPHTEDILFLPPKTEASVPCPKARVSTEGNQSAGRGEESLQLAGKNKNLIHGLQ